MFHNILSQFGLLKSSADLSTRSSSFERVAESSLSIDNHNNEYSYSDIKEKSRLDGVSRDSLSEDAKLLDTLLFDKLKPILLEYISSASKKERKVVRGESQSPEQLSSALSSFLTLPDQAQPDIIVDIVKTTLKYSVATWSPRFMDKLYAGTNPIGVIAELIIAILNTNVHVYHVAPVFTLVELRVLEELGKLVGFENGGGVFCPGGSYSNLHALVTARNYLFPEMLQQGSNCQCAATSRYAFRQNTGPLVIFTSAHSHYSISKSALTMGIGKNHICLVPTDSLGCMSIDCLRKMIIRSLEKGERPFFVNCTAGTTVLGAFDDISAVHRVLLDIKRQYGSSEEPVDTEVPSGIWLHVDGSWGGSAIFSQKHSHLLNGSSLANSITVNPHKLLGVPLLCSALLMRDKHIMQRYNSVDAGYLFHGSEWDLGDGTIGCGRKPDAFKLFLCWMYYGREGFAHRVETALDNAKYLYSQLSTHGLFKGSFMSVINGSPQFTNVCFWYLPPVREESPEQCLKRWVNLRQSSYELFFSQMQTITKSIHVQLVEDGTFMIDYAPLELASEDWVDSTTIQKLPIFFRVVFNHPDIDSRDIDMLLKSIDEIGTNC